MKYFLPIILILSFAYKSFAYPTPVDFEGNLLRWDVDVDNPTIYWEIETDSDSFLEFATEIAMDSTDLWNQVDNSFINLEQATSENIPQITIKFSANLSDSDFSSGYSVFDEFDGTTPKHCTIAVLIYGTDYSIAKTVLHEIGHCIGLGHSLIPEAVMSYSLDKNRFGLDVDDKAAVSRLYPSSGEDPELPPGCAIGSGGQGNPLYIFLLFLLPLAFATLSLQKKHLLPLR